MSTPAISGYQNYKKHLTTLLLVLGVFFFFIHLAYLFITFIQFLSSSSDEWSLLAEIILNITFSLSKFVLVSIVLCSILIIKLKLLLIQKVNWEDAIYNLVIEVILIVILIFSAIFVLEYQGMEFGLLFHYFSRIVAAVIAFVSFTLFRRWQLKKNHLKSVSPSIIIITVYILYFGLVFLKVVFDYEISKMGDLELPIEFSMASPICFYVIPVLAVLQFFFKKKLTYTIAFIFFFAGVAYWVRIIGFYAGMALSCKVGCIHCFGLKSNSYPWILKWMLTGVFCTLPFYYMYLLLKQLKVAKAAVYNERKLSPDSVEISKKRNVEISEKTALMKKLPQIMDNIESALAGEFMPDADWLKETKDFFSRCMNFKVISGKKYGELLSKIILLEKK